MVGTTMAGHPDLRFLFGESDYVFASSANITGDTDRDRRRDRALFAGPE
jgi:hypothetical protein